MGYNASIPAVSEEMKVKQKELSYRSHYRVVSDKE